MDSSSTKKAIALKYEEGDGAPKVIAAARGYIAEKIIRTAEELNIPLISSPDVAEKLVYLKPGQEVPPELYEAIARIYAFLIKIDEDLGSDKDDE